jgi:hypothetical protein
VEQFHRDQVAKPGEGLGKVAPCAHSQPSSRQRKDGPVEEMVGTRVRFAARTHTRGLVPRRALVGLRSMAVQRDGERQAVGLVAGDSSARKRPLLASRRFSRTGAPRRGVLTIGAAGRRTPRLVGRGGSPIRRTVRRSTRPVWRSLLSGVRYRVTRLVAAWRPHSPHARRPEVVGKGPWRDCCLPTVSRF